MVLVVKNGKYMINFLHWFALYSSNLSRLHAASGKNKKELEQEYIKSIISIIHISIFIMIAMVKIMYPNLNG
jgi:hypothetical protein